jgi:hypothetical protein
MDTYQVDKLNELSKKYPRLMRSVIYNTAAPSELIDALHEDAHLIRNDGSSLMGSIIFRSSVNNQKLYNDATDEQMFFIRLEWDHGERYNDFVTHCGHKGLKELFRISEGKVDAASDYLRSRSLKELCDLLELPYKPTLWPNEWKSMRRAIMLSGFSENILFQDTIGDNTLNYIASLTNGSGGSSLEYVALNGVFIFSGSEAGREFWAHIHRTTLIIMPLLPLTGVTDNTGVLTYKTLDDMLDAYQEMKRAGKNPLIVSELTIKLQ